MEKTARVIIIGAAAVLVSGVKLEDWKRVEKYAPETLKMTDDNGEPVFRVASSEYGGTVNHFGVAWGTYTSDEGYATVTTLLHNEVEDKKEAVTRIMGSALLNLREIEKQIPEILEQIVAKEKEIESCITVI